MPRPSVRLLGVLLAACALTGAYDTDDATWEVRRPLPSCRFSPLLFVCVVQPGPQLTRPVHLSRATRARGSLNRQRAHTTESRQSPT